MYFSEFIHKNAIWLLLWYSISFIYIPQILILNHFHLRLVTISQSVGRSMLFYESILGPFPNHSRCLHNWLTALHSHLLQWPTIKQCSNSSKAHFLADCFGCISIHLFFIHLSFTPSFVKSRFDERLDFLFTFDFLFLNWCSACFIWNCLKQFFLKFIEG